MLGNKLTEAKRKSSDQEKSTQQGNTAEDIKRKADKLAELNPSDRNSSSFRGQATSVSFPNKES